jgi:hypothetical protein
MSENRGPDLLDTTLVLGIITVCVVTLRIAFRWYKRRIDVSDWFIGIALVISPGVTHQRALAPPRPSGRAREPALTDP